MLSRFFLDRPVFAWVIAIAMMLAGGLAIYNLPVSQYPPIAPPSISIRAMYPGAVGEDRRGQRRPDHRAEDDGPRPDALHELDLRLVGLGGTDPHVRPGHRSGPRVGEGAEQAPACVAHAARRGPEPRPDGQQVDPELPDDRRPHLGRPRRSSRRTSATTPCRRSRPSRPRAGRRRGRGHGYRATPCASGSTRTASRGTG